MATRHYDDFIERMRMEGISAYDASQFPEARDAHRRDEHEEWERVINAPSKSFYNLQDGQKLDHFRTPSEMQDAISSREYKESATFREAVSRMANNSPCLIEPTRNTQGSGDYINDEQFVAQVRKTADMKATKDAFIQAAGHPERLAALVEKIMADKEGADRVESNFSNEGPLQRAFRQAGHITTGPNLAKAAAGGEEKPSAENMGEGQKR